MKMKKKYSITPNNIWSLPISSNAKLVLIFLFKYRKACFPSRELISLSTGVSVRTVDRNIKELKNLGFVSWKQGKQHQSNVYIINKDKIDSVASQRQLWNPVASQSHSWKESSSVTVADLDSQDCQIVLPVASQWQPNNISNNISNNIIKNNTRETVSSKAVASNDTGIINNIKSSFINFQKTRNAVSVEPTGSTDTGILKVIDSQDSFDSVLGLNQKKGASYPKLVKSISRSKVETSEQAIGFITYLEQHPILSYTILDGVMTVELQEKTVEYHYSKITKDINNKILNTLNPKEVNSDTLAQNFEYQLNQTVSYFGATKPKLEFISSVENLEGNVIKVVFSNERQGTLINLSSLSSEIRTKLLFIIQDPSKSCDKRFPLEKAVC